MNGTRIRYPSADGTVYRGTDCMIVWEYSHHDRSLAPPAVDIELQRAKDGRPVRTIAQRVRNQGSFFWSIGENVPVGGPFRLFVGNMFMATPYGSDETDENGPNAIYSEPFSIRREAHPDSFAQRDPNADSLSLSDAMATMSIEEDRKRNEAASKRRASQMVVTTSEDDAIPQHSCASSSVYPHDRECEQKKKQQKQQQQRKDQQTRSTTRSVVPSAGTPSGASAFALDASGSGGGGGYTAASSNVLSEADKEYLCAYIYSHVQMPASVVRRNLKDIVGDDHVQPGTLLTTGMRAGKFCIYYLLQRYYKKQLARSNPTLERQIEKENKRVSEVTPKLASVLRVPSAYRGASGLGSESSNSPVLFGGTLTTGSGSGSGSGGGGANSREDISMSGSNNSVRKEMSACVEGISIRLEREYLQRIRCWSLNIDQRTTVDLESNVTAEQFALQYVQTDRRKRIENTRRSKDKRKQREMQQCLTRGARDGPVPMDCDRDENDNNEEEPHSRPVTRRSTRLKY